MKIPSKTISCIASAAAIILAVSCATEPTVPQNDANKRFIEAWISVNHPQAEASGLGIYILDDQPGNGSAIDKEDDLYVFVTTTVTDLEGNVTSTSSEKLAQQIGTFSKGNYYGSTVVINDKNYLNAGAYDMINGMKIGGTRTALVPGWLNVTKDYNTAEEYLKNCSGNDAIYKISVVDKTEDITQWEIDSLERYVAVNMSAVDSTFYGYYSQQLVAPKDTTSLPRDTTIYINYTGRLLNGQVFDTTIKDTAKVHGIYSSSRTYEPQSVTLNEEYTSITLGSSTNTDGSTGSTVINGFAYCLSKIKKYEKCVCAFYSGLGYGYSGSGNSIPSFAPIVFEIEVVDEPE